LELPTSIVKLRLVCRPHDPDFLSILPLLIGLEELTVDFVVDEDNPYHPNEEEILLPTLKWLSVSGSSSCLPLKTFFWWEMPQLHHLSIILKDGVDDTLDYTLEAFGEQLFSLSICGHFDYTMDELTLANLCPNLKRLEIDYEKPCFFFDRHPTLEEFIGHSCSKTYDIPSLNMDPFDPLDTHEFNPTYLFGIQVDFFKLRLADFPRLRLVVDTAWPWYIVPSNYLPSLPWWPTGAASFLTQKNIQCIDRERAPVPGSHS